MNGAELIAAERERGIDQEGYDAAHDDRHDRGQLVQAAVAYAQAGLEQVRRPDPDMDRVRRFYWPWEWSFWKPRDPVRNLVIAGALIAAEIDRLQRKGGSK
jgi:hypothetical protein